MEALYDAVHAGRRAVMITIVDKQGSGPRSAGAKMLVCELAGQQLQVTAGSVGGGVLEALAFEAAGRVLAAGVPEVLEFDLNGELAAGADMICGGTVRLVVEPFHPEDAFFVRQLLAALQAGHPVHSLTRLDTGQRQVVVDAPSQGNQGQRKPRLVETEGVQYVMEPWSMSPQLILVGGGHVARATCHMAVTAGFETVVLDDRPEFATALRFPEASLIRVVPGYTQCFASLALDSRTHIVILTRGHVHDAVALEQAVRLWEASPEIPAFIGMIGSIRKRDAIYAALVAKGVSRQLVDRVHCPVGLAIGAETPEEIAVSIVAQCIAVKNGAA